MKGHSEIIQVLNEMLTAELTSINQYFLHSKMLMNWGYLRLGAHARSESIDEMKHADALIERILYLEGIPNVQRLGKVNIGETVLEQFKNDLAIEYGALKVLNDGIKLCQDLGDNGTGELLKQILVSEETHIDWLETQLELAKQIGEANYLAQHIHS